MISRSIARAGALFTAGAVMVVMMATALPVLSSAPAAAVGGPDGLLSWGYNTSGQLGAGFYGSNGPNSCPSDNACSTTPVGVLLPSGVSATATAGGGYSAYAIGSDGHLYAWGDGGLGSLGNGMSVDSDSPVQVSLPSGVSPIAIAASEATGYAIGSDGHLYAWGANAVGQLGDGTNSAICGACGSATPVVVSLPPGVTPTAIAAGGYAAYAIGSDGHLYAWGYNVYGNLGVGNTQSSAVPLLVKLPSGVSPTAVAAAGFYATYAIGSDGHLYAWGDNYSGELGNGTTKEIRRPEQISLPPGVTPAAISGSNAPDGYAIGSDGNLYAWGDNSVGGLGNGMIKGPNSCHSISCSRTPTRVSLPSGLSPAAIAGGSDSAYAIGSDGQLYAWGDNSVGQLGNGTLTGSDTPSPVPLPLGFTPHTLGPEPDSQTGSVSGTTAPGPLTITTSSMPPATVGVAYTASLSATGGNPPYRWKVIAGSLPKGITLNRSTGVISGTTKQTGLLTFTIEVQTKAPTRPPTRSMATKDLSIQLNSASTASDFVSNLPDVPPPSPYAGVGPVGLVFNSADQLLVSDAANLGFYSFGPGGSQNPQPISVGNVQGNLAFAKTGELFSTEYQAGNLDQIDPATGTIIRQLNPSNVTYPCILGLATDPVSGDLFFSQPNSGGVCPGSNTITRVEDPTSATPIFTTYINLAPASADGLAFGPDGSLYAVVQSGTLGCATLISGTDTVGSPTATSISCVTGPGDLAGLDAITLSTHAQEPPTLYVGGPDGTIRTIDQSTTPPTVTATVTLGTRIDALAVGGDGCLYATQSTAVEKVTQDNGDCP